ncbi:hypothetical protein FHR83_004387 [Actinoplanes campanulatus]|uniref:Uncharacterized protein n=1 Tax=Actinoplanes campanulatus TaxID=113559 RepID=A0A7W5FFL3_9ACTN|nr:hypothetical protein [Actinoplanes campanulatus]
MAVPKPSAAAPSRTVASCPQRQAAAAPISTSAGRRVQVSPLRRWTRASRDCRPGFRRPARSAPSTRGPDAASEPVQNQVGQRDRDRQDSMLRSRPNAPVQPPGVGPGPGSQPKLPGPRPKIPAQAQAQPPGAGFRHRPRPRRRLQAQAPDPSSRAQALGPGSGSRLPAQAPGPRFGPRLRAEASGQSGRLRWRGAGGRRVPAGAARWRRGLGSRSTVARSVVSHPPITGSAIPARSRKITLENAHFSALIT